MLWASSLPLRLGVWYHPDGLHRRRVPPAEQRACCRLPLGNGPRFISGRRSDGLATRMIKPPFYSPSDFRNERFGNLEHGRKSCLICTNFRCDPLAFVVPPRINLQVVRRGSRGVIQHCLVVKFLAPINDSPTINARFIRPLCVEEKQHVAGSGNASGRSNFILIPLPLPTLPNRTPKEVCCPLIAVQLIEPSFHELSFRENEPPTVGGSKSVYLILNENVPKGTGATGYV